MREAQRTIYYCDYCRAHRHSRASMAKHEAGCTMNPNRVCRWRIDGHSDGTKQMDIAPIAVELNARAGFAPRSADPDARDDLLLGQDDIDWLRNEVDGCPVCMLAALRQSEVKDFHFDARSTLIFDYATEVERLRREEREAEYAVF